MLDVPLPPMRAVERLATDLPHHVEVAVAHRTVVAVPDRLRHRDADGVQRLDHPEAAVLFLVAIKDALEDPSRLLLGL